MGLLGCASSESQWRGYNYFLSRKVISFKKFSDTRFHGIVSGSNGAEYQVFIDTEHPRSSTCDCPYANGKSIVCKHMIALFFRAFPLEAKKYYDNIMAYEEEAEKQQEEDERKLVSYVSGMKKSELQSALLELLLNGPAWQYDRFLREHIDLYGSEQ